MLSIIQGVHVSLFANPGMKPFFAIHNIGLGSDAGSFHGANILIAQKE